jgi:hypothetical protein
LRRSFNVKRYAFPVHSYRGRGLPAAGSRLPRAGTAPVVTAPGSLLHGDFRKGGGFQAGAGVALTPLVEPRHGARLFLTANFSYDRLGATPGALAQAKAANSTMLGSATGAHGSFSAATLDPTVRFPLSVRNSLYLSGGFGWFRRGVGFNGANPETLTQPEGPTLDKLATDSSAFDLGGGVNLGLSPRGGLMFFMEARVYRGLAVNSGTTLGLVSAGFRW